MLCVAAVAVLAAAAAARAERVRFNDVVYPLSLRRGAAADGARVVSPLVPLVKPLDDTDQCFNATTCEECIARNFCGWCDTPVQGGNNAQCAGFNPNNPKDKPFVCESRYQTTKCLPPPPPPAPPAPPMPPPPPPPVKPVVPPEVTGQWRGLRIERNYKMGEWYLNFTAQNVTVKSPDGKVATAAVFSNDKIMNFKYTAGDYAGKVQMGIYELGFGPVTIDMTLAASTPGLEQAPVSFESAMSGENAGVLLIYKLKEF